MLNISQSYAGQKLAGYSLREKIGTGGMADVYLGYDPEHDRPVAIKIIHPHLLENAQILSRFQREAKVMAALTHPNIVEVYGFDSDAKSSLHFLVMAYIKGETLAERIKKLGQQGRTMPMQQVVDISTKIMDAVHYAHGQNLVHRDIKPGNIMLNANNQPILMDFGIVKLMNQSVAITLTGSLLGTPAYMAPEQALGETGDERSDIYSLGVMLFQMVTGDLPFDADTPMGIIMKHVSEPTPLPGALNPATPIGLHDVIMKAMEKDPHERYQTAVAMMTDLHTVDLSENAQMAPTFLALTSRFEDEIETISSEPLPAPYQIPHSVANFSGRAALLAQLETALTAPDGNRLVGLVGSGGAGKTAVAIQLLPQLKEQFPDGILWAQLDYSTPEAELVNIAAAFGQAEAVSRKYTVAQKAEFVRQILANKNVLLVLDHAHDSEQTKWLIPSGEQNVTLLTTRNSKMLQNMGATILPVAPFSDDEALRFFSQVVGADRIDTERQDALALIRLMGGLPLALSIVTSFLNEATDLSLAEYVELLQDEQTRLANLTDWEDTARDVAASFELSYQALPVPLQRLFDTLAVFDGPDFAARDVAVIAKMPPVQVKLGLGRLHSLSLIGTGLGDREQRLPVGLADEGRYQINPLLRVFAREKLGLEYGRLRQRAADYFANLAHLNNDVDSFPRLDLEWPNIMGAMAWAHQNQLREPLRMGTLALTQQQLGIVGFMDARGHWNEARQLLGWALADIAPSLLRARLLNRQGAFVLKQAEWETAVAILDESEAILNDMTPSQEQALELAYLYDLRHRLALQSDQSAALGWVEKGLQALKRYQKEAAARHESAYLEILRSGVLVKTGALDEAVAAAQAGLAELPADPTPAQIGGYINLGTAYYFQGKIDDSIRTFQQAIPLAEALGDFRRLATATMNLGILQEQNGRFNAAIRNYQKGLQLHRALGNSDDEGSGHINLSSIYTKMGEDAAALTHLQTAVALGQKFNLTELEAFAQVGLADLLLYQEDCRAAEQPLRRAKEICQASEATFSFLLPILQRLTAKCALLQGNTEQALALIDQALALAEADNYLLEQGICWRVKGNIYAAQQHPETAVAYKTSLELLHDQSPYEVAKTQLALARYLISQNVAEAQIDQLLMAAERTFRELQAKRELAQTTALQHSLPN